MDKNIEKSTKCDIIVEKGGLKMSNLIELEAGYKLNDFENILKKIKEYDYKLNYKVTE